MKNPIIQNLLLMETHLTEKFRPLAYIIDMMCGVFTVSCLFGAFYDLFLAVSTITYGIGITMFYIVYMILFLFLGALFLFMFWSFNHILKNKRDVYKIEKK